MQLLPTGTPIRGEKRRLFRHGVLAELFACLLFIGLPLALCWFLRAEILGISGFGLLIAIPMGLFGGLIWMLIVTACLHSLRASLRSTNWLMAVTREGLYLNLRSYRNGHFDGDDPTVALLAFSEIKTAGRFVETRTDYASDKDRRSRRTVSSYFLELTLDAPECAELAAAVAAERLREAPEQRGFLGIRSRTKFRHDPVRVPHAGVIHVEWKRGMLYALEGRVRTVEPRRVSTTADGIGATNAGPQSLENLVDAHLERGEKMQALRLVREESNLSLLDAKNFVEERARRGA